MKEAENPMVIDRRTQPRPQVYRVEVKAIIRASLDIVADDEEYIDDIIDDYADYVIGNMDNLEIDDWEVISVEDWEAYYE